MRLQVVLMRRHGKALEQYQIRSADAVIGDVVVAHVKVEALGRYSDVASMNRSMTELEGLPSLYDVRLAHMGVQGFVLSGIQLEGTIGFAQAWWCRQV